MGAHFGLGDQSSLTAAHCSGTVEKALKRAERTGAMEHPGTVEAATRPTDPRLPRRLPANWGAGSSS